MSKFRLSIFLAAITYFFSPVTWSQPVYLQAKQYLDVQTGKLIQPANLLIENGIIKAINPAAVPDDAIKINHPDLTLLPGLMDAHVHISCDNYNKEIVLTLVTDDAGMSTIRGIKNAKLLLMAGFTTVRDLNQCYPGDSFTTVDLSKASERGWIDAPHIIPAGHALSMTGGHLDASMFGSFAPGVLPDDYRAGIADGVDEVIKSVRYQIKHGAKVIKAAATAGVLSDEAGVGNEQYSFEELKAMVTEANRHGVPVAVHAHGTQGINDAIRAGVRSVEHGSLLNDESIRLMKQNGTYLVPTTYLLFGGMNLDALPPHIRAKAEYILPLAKQNIAKAIKAGVKIGLGTDSSVVPHGENAKELSSLVALGMTPLGAIQAATINDADLFGVKNRGQIRQGFDADIIGVNGDPLNNIRTLEDVKFVMKDGKVYK